MFFNRPVFVAVYEVEIGCLSMSMPFAKEQARWYNLAQYYLAGYVKLPQSTYLLGKRPFHTRGLAAYVLGDTSSLGMHGS